MQTVAALLVYEIVHLLQFGHLIEETVEGCQVYFVHELSSAPTSCSDMSWQVSMVMDVLRQPFEELP